METKHPISTVATEVISSLRRRFGADEVAEPGAPYGGLVGSTSFPASPSQAEKRAYWRERFEPIVTGVSLGDAIVEERAEHG